MCADNENISDTSLPSGEGERRAQRGYVPQYDLGARVIYDGLASGQLQWIGVADRRAGSFDDIVLGLKNTVEAYQVKTSRDPEPFSVRTLLLGAEGLWEKMLDSRRRLKNDFSTSTIETVYACDDYPRTNDRITNDVNVSSAAFIRAHEAQRLTTGLAQWLNSQFGSLIRDLQAASGLSDSDFEEAWRNTRFEVGGGGRKLGLGPQTFPDSRRLSQIAAILPRLAAADIDKDRWTTNELLEELGWRDIFNLRHGHTFPVDTLYETNLPTQNALQQLLSSCDSGYLSLVGPPGCGKSTLLASGLLPTPRAVVIRYLAFVPGEGLGLGRAEAEDFLYDLIQQLKRHDLGRRIVPAGEIGELRAQLGEILRETAHRFQKEGIRTVIVVDGLDHIPREERPDKSLLNELPLPQSVPTGVVFLLGTQRLDLDDIPPSVRRQAAERDRSVVVTPLSREAVSRLADIADVPSDVSRRHIHERTEEHPLSVRYIIEGLLRLKTVEERDEWLTNGPSYGGNIDEFYERAWHEIKSNAEAQRALAYVALVDGTITLRGLDQLVGVAATDAAWSAAGHLLRRDAQGAWTIFHNSFRLFLRDRTSMRHGTLDEASVRRRYGELANMARDADATDPQRWMELRYRARAADHRAVGELTKPERFREQFIEGRNPKDIRADLDFSMTAAAALRDPSLVLTVIFSRHEINRRAEALGDDVFRAFVDLRDYQAAVGVLEADGADLSVGLGYELVDALLASGDTDGARKLFQELEPIDKLFGADTVKLHIKDDEIGNWAKSALAFRDPAQFLLSIARLRFSDSTFNREYDVEDYRLRLKFLAARGHIDRNPSLSLDELRQSLQIEPKYQAHLHYFAAQTAFDTGDKDLLMQSLDAMRGNLAELDPFFRRRASLLAARIDQFELAEAFIDGVAPPSFAYSEDDFGRKALSSTTDQVIAHAKIRSWLNKPFEGGERPRVHLLALFQSKLETIGQIMGTARAGRLPDKDVLREFRGILDFLQHGSDGESHSSARWQIDLIIDKAVAGMTDAVGMLGGDTLARFCVLMDERLASEPGRLGQPFICRAYAKAVYRFDHNTEAAERRLSYIPGSQNTPGEQFAEAANTAKVLRRIGLPDRARSLLVEMHDDGLGYSRRAKKDPQYVIWRELLKRANAEDPAGRPSRIRFFGRLLSGLDHTEGYDAGRRLSSVFLTEAAQAGPAWAHAAVDHAEKTGLSTWSAVARSLLEGVLRERPDLASIIGVIYGRIALAFGEDADNNFYIGLIGRAPSEQIHGVARHAIECLETDARPGARIALLEEAVDAATARGLAFGSEALARWRTELPPPKSGESPEDPFFLTRSLDEIAEKLGQTGERSDGYRAVRAFVRLAPKSDYQAAKALFERFAVLRDDERAIDAIAQIAVSRGERHDALSYLTKLKTIADEKGSWGDSWQSNTKQRYHRLRIALEGDTARREAFNAFVKDLSERRESVEYLLPSLDNVLDLLLPRVSWAETWDHLQNHLLNFREYKIGEDFHPASIEERTHEATLADTLYRAIDLSAGDLCHMARTAAIEIAPLPGSVEVLAVLVKRLWKAGHYNALEAAQIAWECRSVAAVRPAIQPLLSAMMASKDFSVKRIAATLAADWGIDTEFPVRTLPLIYQFHLQDHLDVNRFDPPSGISETGPGLYTEDMYAWTWPLEDALKMTVRASGLEMANLRTRAAQLMDRSGGTAAFGPEAESHKKKRRGSLRLHLRHRKLLSAAAYQAMREVVGELEAADAIDPRAIQHILRLSGGFSSCIQTLPPVPRPTGVSAPIIFDHFRSVERDQWFAEVDADAVAPSFDGYTVLAATAVHERRHFNEVHRTTQYYGPDSGVHEDGLFSQVRRLPTVVIADAINSLYYELAPGAVASVKPTQAGSVDLYTVTLCPRVAAEVNWRADADNSYLYRREDHEIVANTIFWRDGGVNAEVTDSATFRHGCLLVVRDDVASQIAPYISEPRIALAWREFHTLGQDDRRFTRGYRRDPVQ